MKRPDLTLDERYTIHNALLGGLTVDEIAKAIRRDRSTIYRELKRGRRHRLGAYCPHRAQRRHNEHRLSSSQNAVTKSAMLWADIKNQLKAGKTPDEIAGRLAHIEQHCQITAQGIYQHIYQYGWRRWLKSARRRKHMSRPARRKWHGSARRIQERSIEATLRIEFGHYEVDSMLGKRSDKKRLLVIVERQSLFTFLLAVRSTNALSIAKRLKRYLASCGLPFLSLTSDRGWEFSALGDVMPDKAYICDPYAPNQRGTNENQIGRLRVEFPKGVSMDKLSARKLKRIADKHNHTPRAALGYWTPFEVAFNSPPPVASRC
jgi:transposase, IS30 family